MTELLNISALSLYLIMGRKVASRVMIEAPTGYRFFSLVRKVKAFGGSGGTCLRLLVRWPQTNVSCIVAVYRESGGGGGKM